MTYKIRLSARARHDLELGLSPAVGAAIVEFIYGPLAQNPQRVGKPLRAPLEGQYSARRGEYRIIYTINEAEIVVTVVTLRHRRNAYR